jgi:hypothetical protein
MALTERFGLVRARATFVHAAILAADAARDAGGFRANDVRFYFLLFTNWVEHDLVRPDQDLELTQVRRVLERLAARGWARSSGQKARARRGGAHTLTPSGVVGLVEELVAARAERTFDEMLFLVLFAASYRDLVALHDPSKRVEDLLDPRRLLRAARSTVSSVSADLETRVAAGHAIERSVADATQRGLDAIAIARRLEQVDAYQLQRIRSLSELFASLPDAIARHEVERGIALRRQLLFEPLAERARAELAILDRLEKQLADAAR